MIEVKAHIKTKEQFETLISKLRENPKPCTLCGKPPFTVAYYSPPDNKGVTKGCGVVYFLCKDCMDDVENSAVKLEELLEKRKESLH